MTVYVDVVLLENISMNYIILLASSLIGNRKIYFFKVFMASFIGGLYSIVNYVIDISWFANIIFKIFNIKIIIPKYIYMIHNA